MLTYDDTKCSLEQFLNSCTQFLSNHLKLLSAHTNQFFTHDHIQMIPEKLKKELSAMSVEELIEFPGRNLTEFDESERQLRNLKECLMNLRLESNLIEDQLLFSNSISTHFTAMNCSKLHLSEKKHHEVIEYSKFLSDVMANNDLTKLVDLGSGKGYLSETLQRLYGFNVIGVECSGDINKSSEKRNLKMSRIWRKMEDVPTGTISPNIEKSSIAKFSDEEHRKKPQRDFEKEKVLSSAFNEKLLRGSYTQITERVNDAFDLSKITENEPHALIGLHTCGDLAVSSIKLYSNCESCKVIVNVGCCYNTLTETCEEKSQNGAFPLSNFLRNQGFKLGSAKSLACLSPEKTAVNSEKNPIKKIFNRALLQKLVLEYFGYSLDRKRIFCKNKANKTFLEYIRAVQSVFNDENVDLSKLSDEFINQYEDDHLPRQKELLAFNQYRACFAPVLESLILVDRLLYLKESGFESSCIVKIFDPKISPRCYAIMASK